MTDWAANAIATLKAGKQVTIRPRGNSMRPLVESGQEVTLEPCSVQDLVIGDVVLCRVNGRSYLHLVKAIDGLRVLIGNNRGGVNGWTRTVYGRAKLS